MAQSSGSGGRKVGRRDLQVRAEYLAGNDRHVVVRVAAGPQAATENPQLTLPSWQGTVAIHHSRPRQKAEETIAGTGWYWLKNGALHGALRHITYSHTTPSPSPSRMYRYAGCPRRTGAIPCRLASLHVIRPLPLPLSS